MNGHKFDPEKCTNMYEFFRRKLHFPRFLALLLTVPLARIFIKQVRQNWLHERVYPFLHDVNRVMGVFVIGAMAIAFLTFIFIILRDGAIEAREDYEEYQRLNGIEQANPYEDEKSKMQRAREEWDNYQKQKKKKKLHKNYYD